MSSKKEKPKILILGGALEYQRVSNLLSSFDTLLQQVLPVNSSLFTLML
jgi:1-phosphatidylinositol-3-phosphate 5-kinase